ncbi:MAG: hypothetical protein ACOX83_00180 [Candidatus Spyradocola sp.]|jgi:hypothetical protein
MTVHPALGLPLSLALEQLGEENCRVKWTRPPRHPDKTGSARTVRIRENGGTVEITVSPFEDVLKEEQ